MPRKGATEDAGQDDGVLAKVNTEATVEAEPEQEAPEPRQATLEEVNAYMFRLAYPNAGKGE